MKKQNYSNMTENEIKEKIKEEVVKGGYSEEEFDLYSGEAGWQDWMNDYTEADDGEECSESELAEITKIQKEAFADVFSQKTNKYFVKIKFQALRQEIRYINSNWKNIYKEYKSLYSASDSLLNLRVEDLFTKEEALSALDEIKEIANAEKWKIDDVTTILEISVEENINNKDFLKQGREIKKILNTVNL